MVELTMVEPENTVQRKKRRVAVKKARIGEVMGFIMPICGMSVIVLALTNSCPAIPSAKALAIAAWAINFLNGAIPFLFRAKSTEAAGGKVHPLVAFVVAILGPVQLVVGISCLVVALGSGTYFNGPGSLECAASARTHTRGSGWQSDPIEPSRSSRAMQGCRNSLFFFNRDAASQWDSPRGLREQRLV